MKTIDKLGWIYIKDKKILYTRSKGKDVFYIPGGKREKGETDKEALAREIKEELGIKLIQESLKFLGRFEGPAHGEGKEVILKMTCYLGNFTGRIHPTSEIKEVIWLTLKDKERTTPMGQIILNWLKRKDLID